MDPAPAIGEEEVALLGAAQERAPLDLRRYLLGSLLVPVGLFGLYIWYGADYFHHEGGYGAGWTGYTRKDLLGLCLFAFLFPPGCYLFYTCIKMSLGNFSRKKRVYGLLTVSLLVLICGLLGIVWGQESLKCLVVFCLDKNKYVEIQRARPEAGLGFLSIIGMSVLFLFSGIGFSMFLSTLSSTTPAARRFLRFISPLPVRTGVAVVLLTLFGIVTFYIPNSWEFFVAARIANNAHLIASTSHETCLDWRNYTCPELPWSLMKTKNVFVSENLVLKLYPSNLIFFSYLFVVVCVGILLKFSKKSRMWTSSPWRCDLTYGELAFSGLTIFATGAFFFYWIHDHNYNDLWDGGDSAGISASERWARAFGQLAVLFLSFLLFPAAKTSFLYSIFQISRENTMWVHKVLGYGMLLATFLHMILWYYFYYENGDFPHDVYAVPLRTSIAKSNFTVPLVSYATWFMFVAVGIFGFWKLRRKFYDIFHMLHLISFTLILPAVLWHAAAGWEYVLPGFCVWLSDKLLSIYRCTEETSIISLTAVSASVAKLSFALTSSQQGGEYVLLNIPEISVVEWHPFSLCNDGHESFVLIKSMGPGTWTGNVLKFATQDTPSKLRLYVDGPCGGENRLDDYEHILFVAGGIGITGCLSLLKKAIQKSGNRASLSWSCRDAELSRTVGNILKEYLNESQTSGSVFSYEIHYTGNDNVENFNDCEFVSFGRAEISSEARDFVTDKQKTIIFACGPSDMISKVLTDSVEFGVGFHSEIFEF